MTRFALPAVLLFALVACKPAEPPPPNPLLLAAAERDVAPNTTSFVTDGRLASGFYFLVDSGYGYPRRHPDAKDLPADLVLYGTELMLFVDPSPIVTVGNFSNIMADEDMTGEPEVNLVMDEVGRVRWLVATRRSVNKPLAIVVNDQVVSAPIVMSEIAGGHASIGMRQATEQQTEDFARMLEHERTQVAPIR
ncbi:MAG TPA: hypothetical protein PK760_06940 [Flavobacteriales bacterium]|nr:hypothetical protein [Flavobacteriales bacterium]